jgi:hypothetical protein
MAGARDKRLSFLDPLTRRPTKRLLLRRASILRNGTQRRGSRYLYQPNSVIADEAGCFVVVVDAGGLRRSLRIALPSGPRRASNIATGAHRRAGRTFSVPPPYQPL